MAALRLTARRLALQRPNASVVSPAAAAELLPRIGPPVLSRRFTTSSGAQISNNKHRCATPAATGGEKERFASRVALLDTKKEELYNLLAEIERNRKYRVSSMLGRHQNRVLLQHLSVQVDVKPDDTEWRRFRRSHLTVVSTRLGWRGFTWPR